MSDNESEFTKGKAKEIENTLLLPTEEDSRSDNNQDGKPKVEIKFIIVSTPATTDSIVLPSIEPSNSDTIGPITREI